MNVLQLSAHYAPNIGGVETHLQDLVEGLAVKKYQVTVLTYQPLSTDISAPWYEKKHNTTIVRLPWIRGWFYRLVDNPILEFSYLFPGLFLAYPIIMLQNKIDVVHAHGLVAVSVAVIWNLIFGKKIVLSTHSLYHFPKSGLYRIFTKFIVYQVDWCLCLSRKSVEEMIRLGIKPAKIKQFVYWIDTSLFKPVRSENWKETLQLKKKFVVLFVGRLVKEKGIGILLHAFKTFKKSFVLIVAGDGPMRDEVVTMAQKYPTIRFAGRLSGHELVDYYNASDLLVVPSIHEEGFGRVVLEALASGTPVVGSKRGSIPEALDLSVGRLIDVSVSAIKKEVTYLKNHPDVLKKLKQNARPFAVRRYSKKNLQTILKAYDN